MKEIELDDSTSVSALAQILQVPASRVIEIGFSRHGLLLTISEVLPFDRAKLVAEDLGYTVRRRGSR